MRHCAEELRVTTKDHAQVIAHTVRRLSRDGRKSTWGIADSNGARLSTSTVAESISLDGASNGLRPLRLSRRSTAIAWDVGLLQD